MALNDLVIHQVMSRPIVATDSPYQMYAGHIYTYNLVPGNITLQMPGSPLANQWVTIKGLTEAAHSNTLTIQPDGVNRVEIPFDEDYSFFTTTSFALDQPHGAIRWLYDGDQWVIDNSYRSGGYGGTSLTPHLANFGYFGSWNAVTQSVVPLLKDWDNGTGNYSIVGSGETTKIQMAAEGNYDVDYVIIATPPFSIDENLPPGTSRTYPGISFFDGGLDVDGAYASYIAPYNFEHRLYAGASNVLITPGQELTTRADQYGALHSMVGSATFQTNKANGQIALNLGLPEYSSVWSLEVYVTLFAVL